MQPTVLVHVAWVQRVREWRNYTPGECVSISAVHEPGSGWGGVMAIEIYNVSNYMGD